MAARIRMLQLAIALVNVVIFGLVLTSVWPFPSGQFKVDLPSASEVRWTYSDGIVQVVAPFSIDNGGYYDVDDLSISYQVSNYSRYILASDTISIGRIPAGQITSSSLKFEFDLLGLYEDGAVWMVFNEDMLYFRIEVSCLYTMKLVKFDADYSVSMPWAPPIESYDVNPVWPPVGTEVTVNWWLNTSRLLSAVPPATLTVQIIGYDGPDGTGSATPLDTIQQNIQLGGREEGTVTLDIPLVPYASYEVVYSWDVGGFGMPEQSYIFPGVTP